MFSGCPQVPACRLRGEVPLKSPVSLDVSGWQTGNSPGTPNPKAACRTASSTWQGHGFEEKSKPSKPHKFNQKFAG